METMYAAVIAVLFVALLTEMRANQQANKTLRALLYAVEQSVDGKGKFYRTDKGTVLFKEI